MKEKGGLSSSQEDYLKQIYVLAQRSEEVRVTDIAKLLEISKPSRDILNMSITARSN